VDSGAKIDGGSFAEEFMGKLSEVPYFKCLSYFHFGLSPVLDTRPLATLAAPALLFPSLILPMRWATPRQLAPPERSGVVFLAAEVTTGLFALGVGSRLLRLLAMTLAGLIFLLCMGLSSPPFFSLSCPFTTALCLLALTGVARRGVPVLEAGVVGLVGRHLVGLGCALG